MLLSNLICIKIFYLYLVDNPKQAITGLPVFISLGVIISTVPLPYLLKLLSAAFVIGIIQLDLSQRTNELNDSEESGIINEIQNDFHP